MTWPSKNSLPLLKVNVFLFAVVFQGFGTHQTPSFEAWNENFRQRVSISLRREHFRSVTFLFLFSADLVGSAGYASESSSQAVGAVQAQIKSDAQIEEDVQAVVNDVEAIPSPKQVLIKQIQKPLRQTGLIISPQFWRNCLREICFGSEILRSQTWKCHSPHPTHHVATICFRSADKQNWTD